MRKLLLKRQTQRKRENKAIQTKTERPQMQAIETKLSKKTKLENEYQKDRS